MPIRRRLSLPIVVSLSVLSACGGGGDAGSATAPAIVEAPKATGVAWGQSATFSVTASGDGPLGYQWRRNGVPVAGAMAATFTLAEARLADNGARFR